MNRRYLTGAIAGSLAAGLGITAMMMAGEKKSGKPSELIDLERESARKLAIDTPSEGLPTASEQVIAQGGHLLLSGLAGLTYAAVTDENTNPVIGGALFGLSFYALAHWLAGPALGVKAPEWQQGGKTIGMHTLNHVGFGIITALAAHGAAKAGTSSPAQPRPAVAGDLLQPGWREITRSINGLNLHIVEAGNADDPLLILLHGFPEFWWAWRHQITPLAEAGYHVVVPDMRGYNTSDAPQEVFAYGIDTLAADVVAIADAFGADRFNLVAHDWGAVIGWWVAARYPDRLERVVLMDGPHPDVWGKQALKHPTQALRSTYVAFFQLPWVPEATLGGFDFAGLKAMMQGSAHKGTFEPGALDRYVEAWSHPGSLTAMLNYYRALRERRSGDQPARVAPPTLILWAGDDKFLERNVAEAGHALCDQGTLEFVEGASHWLHIEQPERINARIIRWLATGK